MRIETLAVHAGRQIDPATRAVAAPIHLSTTFERAEDGTLPGGFVYSREGNPNRDALERCLAELEGGAAAAAFSSGSAATSTLLQSLSPGDHVVAPRDAYYGTQNLLRTVFAPWGLEATFADMTDAAEVQRAMRPNTRLVWIESPSNPLFTITDIARVAEIAHAGGARCVCDNTFATPVLQRPLELGADVVMHATTKYIGGQSDVLGGALVSREDDASFRRVREIQRAGGAVPSPFECWLLLRSVSTLPHRMRQHSSSAQAVAGFLAEHPAVHAVYYPGLASHAGSDVAARQMRMPGGMLSFRVRGGREWALRVAANVRLFTRATSLGGAESLIEHRATVEGPASRTPDDLLRCSIGLEHPDDLIDDLRQALDRRD